MPRTRHEQRDVLQMARKIWRYGCLNAGPAQRNGGGNHRLKKMYAEERLKAGIVQEALQKKW